MVTETTHGRGRAPGLRVPFRGERSFPSVPHHCLFPDGPPRAPTGLLGDELQKGCSVSNSSSAILLVLQILGTSVPSSVK